MFCVFFLSHYYSNRGVNGDRKCTLSFLRGPVKIYPSTTTGRVSGIQLEINALKVNVISFRYLS